MEDKKDFANTHGDAYSWASPHLLGEMHRFLIARMRLYAPRIRDSVWVIHGPGPGFTPYSQIESEKFLFSAGKNSRIILMDYSDKVLEALPEVIKNSQVGKFYEIGPYFGRGSKEIDVNALPKGSISFLHGDLRKKILISDGKVRFQDASLSAHHVTETNRAHKRLYSEFYRIASPDGVLHLGEGAVDMSFTEVKLKELGKLFSGFLNEKILLIDGRTEDVFPQVYEFDPLREYEELPALEDLEKKNTSSRLVEICSDGMVRLDTDNPAKRAELIDFLKQKGHQVIALPGDSRVSLPFIDKNLADDRKFYIEPVNNFYGYLHNKAVLTLPKDDPRFRAMIDGIENERKNAVRGLVENYRGIESILNNLELVGFKNAKSFWHAPPDGLGDASSPFDIFYNIFSEKPAA